MVYQSSGYGLSEVFTHREGLSTTDFLNRMNDTLSIQPQLLPVPQSLLVILATALGKKPMVQRLCDSLQVDISKAHELLGWTRPLSVDEGLRLVANSYLTAVTK